MDKIIDLLKTHNLNKTITRIELLSLLFSSKKPLTILDFKKNNALKNVDESSIYRNLTTFVDKGIIQIVPTASEMKHYELKVSKEKHHHHIVCTSCKVIKCLGLCSFEKKFLEMAKKAGYLLKGHSVELYGLCEKCK